VKLRVTLAGRDVLVDLPDLPGVSPRVDGDPAGAEVRRLGPGHYGVLLDGRSFEVLLDLAGGTEGGAGEGLVSVDGRTLPLRVEDERLRAGGAGAGKAGAGGGAGGAVTVAAPMPGRVVAVPVNPGDQVLRGQTVVVLEAMKMESSLATPHPGTVVEVLVSPGQTVQQRQALVRIDGAGG
jgi:biotin carboxyl carrier protein